MNLMRTIIVDDEPDSIKLLDILLKKKCPTADVIATFVSPVKALSEIEALLPDLLLLDIEMPQMNGFELLEKLVYQDFKVIFITAYNQFAVQAFKFNALDFLLKPVNETELQEAIHRAGKQLKPTHQQLINLQKQLLGDRITKIAIPSANGVSFIDFNDILYIESSNNYSKLLLTDGRTYTVSKTLKDVQEVLEERQFMRIHRQYIVNLNQVKHLNRNEGLLTMTNQHVLPVARHQKERLMTKYGWL